MNESALLALDLAPDTQLLQAIIQARVCVCVCVCVIMESALLALDLAPDTQLLQAIIQVCVGAVGVWGGGC